MDGFPRTFPCRSTVPPVLRQFCPASFPPLSESSEKSEGSELSSRPLHRPTGSSVLHPSSLHRSAVTLAVPQHTKKCDSIFTRCRGFSPARGLGRGAPCSFPAAVPSAKGRATKEREPTEKTRTIRTARTACDSARGPGNANFSDDSDSAHYMEQSERTGDRIIVPEVQSSAQRPPGERQQPFPHWPPVHHRKPDPLPDAQWFRPVPFHRKEPIPRSLPSERKTPV